ncbi:hemolysin XhlA family protein [Niallia taxi]|uniref:hemolysin XhlA family protein n=1 Tax=Niallia taxi TaxID=2499688 RepID=UPI003F6082C2
MDAWKNITQDKIDLLFKNREIDRKDIDELKNITAFHERDIKDIKDTLKDIKEDTKWLKRTITAAIITAVCTGIIAGSIGVFYNLLQK